MRGSYVTHHGSPIVMCTHSNDRVAINSHVGYEMGRYTSHISQLVETMDRRAEHRGSHHDHASSSKSALFMTSKILVHGSPSGVAT